jgi:hypothetical protein
MFAMATMLVLAVAFLIQAVDPSGHWVGVVKLPEMMLQIEIDIGKSASGQTVATFGQPEQRIKGLPFSAITIDGRTVRLVLKSVPARRRAECRGIGDHRHLGPSRHKTAGDVCARDEVSCWQSCTWRRGRLGAECA